MTIDRSKEKIHRRGSLNFEENNNELVNYPETVRIEYFNINFS